MATSTGSLAQNRKPPREGLRCIANLSANHLLNLGVQTPPAGKALRLRARAMSQAPAAYTVADLLRATGLNKDSL